MNVSQLVYYGPAGLQSDTVVAYFAKLGFRVRAPHTMAETLDLVRAEPNALLVLDMDASPPTLIQLCRTIVQDPDSGFPHIFILHNGKPFDTTMEAVTLITGRDKLRSLASHVSAFARTA